MRIAHRANSTGQGTVRSEGREQSRISLLAEESGWGLLGLAVLPVPAGALKWDSDMVTAP